MRCHLCGSFVSAKKLEVHLRKNHRKYYSNLFNYAFLDHKTKYGEEYARFLMSDLFKKRKKI
jgi:hypothetical protein